MHAARGYHNQPVLLGVQHPRDRQVRRLEDATSAHKTTSEVGVIMAGNPRGADGTSARKMGEKGRLAKCQAAECEGLGATLRRAVV